MGDKGIQTALSKSISRPLTFPRLYYLILSHSKKILQKKYRNTIIKENFLYFYNKYSFKKKKNDNTAATWGRN